MKKYFFPAVFAAIILSSCSGASSHYEGDGHNHEHEADEQSHAEDEILFTKHQAEAIGLRLEEVKRGAFSQVIKTSGRILPAQGDEVTLVATVSGVVNYPSQSLSEGAPISKGASVATLKSANMPDGDPFVKTKITYETALTEYRRAEELVKDRIISAREFEQARLSYENARAAYNAQAPNATAGGAKVVSNIDGYIKTLLVGNGEYVTAGQPVAIVSQNRRLQLRAEVSESYFRDLKKINSANFKMSYGDRVYKLAELDGRLLSFGKASTNSSFYIPVTFEFDNVGDVIPGSYAEVYLLSLNEENAVSIPLSALTEEQGLYFVYVQLDEEGYRKSEVTVGENDGERVKILSGLKEGDKVVTKGAYQVKLAASSSVIPEGHSH